MKRVACFFLLCAFFLGNLPSHAAAAGDWPAWRGPTRDGIATPGQKTPTQWSETENVIWKSKIPGRGHGSPIVVGDRIYLATADMTKKSQSVICLDRATGKSLWTTEVHSSGAESGNHNHSSAASSSVTYDGNQLFINFLNSKAVYTTALDLNGKKLWQQKICDYVIHQGFGASAVVHGSMVLVAADHKGGGVIAGLDRKTGKTVWTQPRPNLPNYSTPAILQVSGRTQMVLPGCNLITSLDPNTGEKLWEIEGSTEECVVTAVTDGERIITSGGYPRNHTVAVAGDGSGKIAWQNSTRVYVPSMVLKEKHIYAVTDSGVATCWKSDTGAENWKERLGGDFFASPVMVDNLIYASNLGGKTYVYEATPSTFKLISQNQLGDEAYASPVICGNRVYLRHAKKGQPREEYLYCIGTK